MLIKGGRLMNPADQTDQILDILIEDGVITKIAENIPVEEGQEVIDATGLVVAPGLLDTHVHFRDPGLTYKEDLHTGSLAAAKGGFTTVICMANTKPVVDSVEVLGDIIERAKAEKIRVLQTAAVSKNFNGKDMTPMEELKLAGAAGFTDDGFPLMSGDFIYKAMKKAAELNMPISLHEEDKGFIKQNGINHGVVSKKLGIYGSPAVAEESMVARDAYLCLRTGANVVIQHISSGKSVDIVKTYQQKGAKLHAEATPHHFTLTEEAVLEHGTFAKMNPPLRTEEDRQQIIKGLQDGTIDLIATDHAPHSAEEKARPLTEAPSGITGLETSLGLGITSLVKPGYLSLMQLLEKMTVNPAKLYHLPYGTIEEGASADFCIFAENETFVAGDYVSKADNTPFTGKKLYGKIYYTICEGNIAYQVK